MNCLNKTISLPWSDLGSFGFNGLSIYNTANDKIYVVNADPSGYKIWVVDTILQTVNPVIGTTTSDRHTHLAIYPTKNKVFVSRVQSNSISIQKGIIQICASPVSAS